MFDKVRYTRTREEGGRVSDGDPKPGREARKGICDGKRRGGGNKEMAQSCDTFWGGENHGVGSDMLLKIRGMPVENA